MPLWTEGYDIVAAREADREPRWPSAGSRSPKSPISMPRECASGSMCRRERPWPGRPRHGGGFVFNDVDVHDAACRRLANRPGLRVLSVDYRCPPEHRFPAAPDDVSSVVAWLDADAPAELRAGPTYVHGDSAGGNLALVAALRHPGRFAAAVLIYPFLDPAAGWDSYLTAADGFDPQRRPGTGSSTPPRRTT